MRHTLPAVAKFVGIRRREVSALSAVAALVRSRRGRWRSVDTVADLEVRVGPPVIVVHADDHFVVTEPDGTIDPGRQQGFFASDTRLISRYNLQINGERPTLLNSAAVTASGARYEFTNPPLGSGEDALPEHVVHLRIDRVVGDGVHEDYDLVNYHDDEIDLTLEVSTESDFSDLFDVKAGKVARRGTRESRWSDGRLDTVYRNAEFERAVRIEIVSPTSVPHYADGSIWFRVQLAPRGTWHACVYWLPVVGGTDPIKHEEPCHEIAGDRSPRRRQAAKWRQQCARFETSDRDVTSTVERSIDDLADLRIRRHDIEGTDGDEASGSWTVAAGVPWFVTLFGRDSLVVALQTFAVAPCFALGMLRALVPLQGDGLDDWRDMQPGKIEHEIRHGELAALRLHPTSPVLRDP